MFVEYSGVLRTDVWAPKNHLLWGAFSSRTGWHEQLLVLEHLFPLQWRREMFGRRKPSLHSLPNDLKTPSGRTRLLDVAAGLLREKAGPVSSRRGAPWRIPMDGCFRYAPRYNHIVSEFLVGPLLLPVGDLKWQPPPTKGPRADYLVLHGAGAVVVEVKRLRMSDMAKALEKKKDLEIGRAMTRGEMPVQGQSLLTPKESEACLRAEMPRLRKHASHASKQLEASGRHVQRVGRLRRGCVLRVLFLDVQENPDLVNLQKVIHGWMTETDWGKRIDLVVGFFYQSYAGISGTVATPFFTRGPEPCWTLFGAHPAHLFCKPHLHLHLAGVPEGGCTGGFGV